MSFTTFKISFRKNHAEIDAPAGANLMQVLLEAGLPVASSCYGEGVCSKCRLTIVEGQKNLSPESEAETFLKESNQVPIEMRISCQVQVLGPITIDATYW